MSTLYRSRDGDMIDGVCFAHYGTVAALATVLAANPGLAARGLVLGAGVEIELPDVAPRPIIQPVRLY